MQPPQYNPLTGFQEEETNQVSGRSTVRTSAVDAELAAIQASINALVANIGIIQRDDTQLRDGTVTVASLSSAVTALLASSSFVVRGPWLTTTVYALGDVVSSGTGTYLCVVAHTSGTFATDLAAGKWSLIFDPAAVAASAVSFTPAGGVAASTVQAAIEEVDTEKLAKASNLSDLASASSGLDNLGFSAFVKTLIAAATSAALRILIGAPTSLVGMINGTIVATRNASAETIAIKTLAGADPSAADPVIFTFRNATAATGDYSRVEVTSALSVTISSGSEMGATNSELFRLWLVAFNDAGTVRLGVINCVSGVAVYGLSDGGIYSATAEGGAGGADSAHVIYSPATVTSKALRVLGYLEYTLAAKGTWNAAPSKIQLWHPDMALPGHTVQCQRAETQATATGVGVVIPYDTTIPQNTEGNELLTQGIIPRSGANLLRISAHAVYCHSAGTACVLALFQDTTADAIVASSTVSGAAAVATSLPLNHTRRAYNTSATTFKLRAGTPNAGNYYFNRDAANNQLGGKFTSFLQVEEIMG